MSRAASASFAILLACATARTPDAVDDCGGSERDACLAGLALRQLSVNPDVGIAALEAIEDPEVRFAAGGTILADRSLVFDFSTSKLICTALHDSFEESFCQRRLGQGHLRPP